MKNNLPVNVVGKIDGKSGIGKHTEAFLYCLKDAFNVNFIDTRPEVSDHKFIPQGVSVNRPATSTDGISIFTDVTCNGWDDTNWGKTPATNLKYIYSVFDSTRIPVHWADIINNHYDAVLVPSKFLVDVYRKSKVQKPIFHLPLAIDLSPFIAKTPPILRQDRPFRFGFIGSLERRKNIDALAKAFNDAFSADDDVELIIHCALNFFEDTALIDSIARKDPRIKFSSGALDSDQYQSLIDEIDCFVSLSVAEGFSIVPREFLAAGKPVALSDNFAHSEILSELSSCGEGLGFGIESDIPIPAVYDHVYGGGIFGIQYDVYQPSACLTLRRIFKMRHSLFDIVLVKKRRDWARSYDMERLKGLYRSIVFPSFVRRTTGNEFEFGGVSTCDANLLSRLTGRNHSMALTEVIKPTPVKYVVIGNDGGFFSVFNRFVSYLTWATTENCQSVVLPDWRIESMKKHWNTEKFTSFCYGTPEDGNIWLKLFEPLPYKDYSESDYDNGDRLYQDAALKDDFNEKAEPWLTYIHAYKLYKSPGFQRWRHWYHLHLQTYVKPRQHIRDTVDAFYEKNLRGYTVISAHIRHPSHGIEQPGSRMPTVELFCELIQQLLSEKQLSRHKTKIFLATDQETVVDVVKERFEEMLVCSPDAARTSKAHDEKFNKLSHDEKMREGHQIQHLTAADPGKWSTKMAEEVIIDTYILAKGDYFIHVTSNIATAVSFINPSIQMVYCE
jgi:hypothetical protein